MKLRHLLFAICLVSAGGVIFSGYMTAVEFSSNAGCSSMTILGLPVCVYGLLMYLLLLGLSLISLNKLTRAKRDKPSGES